MVRCSVRKRRTLAIPKATDSQFELIWRDTVEPAQDKPIVGPQNKKNIQHQSEAS